MQITQERIEQERMRTERIIKRRKQFMLRSISRSVDHLYDAWEEAEKVIMMTPDLNAEFSSLIKKIEGAKKLV